EERNGLALALQRNARTSLEVDLSVAKEAARLLADEDHVARLPRRGFDPRGDVDGVADHAELESSGASDVACDDAARVEPDPHGELRAELVLDGRGDAQRCSECRVGVIGTPARRAEDREQTVADELVDV